MTDLRNLMGVNLVYMWDLNTSSTPATHSAPYLCKALECSDCKCIAVCGIRSVVVRRSYVKNGRCAEAYMYGTCLHTVDYARQLTRFPRETLDIFERDGIRHSQNAQRNIVIVANLAAKN